MDDETQATGQQVPADDADTTSTQASEADVQTNNDAPEATQPEVNTEEVKAEDTAEDKLYAGKYKSPEDMEKAYKELESKFGKETSEKAELTRILNEAFTVPEPQEDTQQVMDSTETNPLNEKVDRLDRQAAVQNFIFAHPDANAVGMNDVLTKDPVIKNIQGHDAKLEYAYFKSQNMSSSEAIEEAKKSAASQAQAKVVEKQAAQVEGAKKAEQSNDNSELYEKATGNYSREERDEARKALIRKNLVNL